MDWANQNILAVGEHVMDTTNLGRKLCNAILEHLFA
jgi:hypothetical protein